jgi:DedD protein
LRIFMAQAASPNPNPSDQARTRARRTLIGSIILALTAVVVVPLLLDSKPQPWSDSVKLQIPAKDSKFDTPLPPPSVTASPTPTAVAPSPSPAAVVPPASPVAAQPAKSVESKPTPPAAPTPKPTPTPKPAAAVAEPSKAGKVVLQAGAFTTEERIKAVEVDLRKAGFSPYREEVPAKNGTVTRVRFAVASAQAAEKAVAKLAAAGITAKVVAP